MTDKHFIDANSQQQDAFELAARVMQSGFQPTFIVAIWRGGAAIGATVQEFLACCGCKTDHIAIRTSSYLGIDKRSADIRVHGLHYLTKRLTSEDRVLLVDDVHDTGLSLAEVIKQIHQQSEHQPQEIRSATLYYKPTNSQVSFKPDYYLHETDKWLVFPHELAGLTPQELIEHKPGIASVKDWLLSHHQDMDYKNTHQE